jgi:L-rhamnose isomerase
MHSGRRDDLAVKHAVSEDEGKRLVRYPVASRLNSFRTPGVDVADAIRRMAAVPGVGALELNFPQHVAALREGELASLLAETGLPLTALNLRFEGQRFHHGAFTAPDAATRSEAVHIAREAVDVAAAHGANHVVLWMADDGWDYPFQADYGSLWAREIDGFRAVAAWNPAVRVSVEYKPFEPRRVSLIRTMSDALLAAHEVALPNFGVSIDVCHAYMAGEHPPAAAAAALRSGKLFGVHLNDGYGRADDGLIFGSVHPRDALELLCVLVEGGYAGTLYFDTFPVREDPAAELAANIAALERLLADLGRIDGERMAAAQAAQDAIAIERLVALR